jgi:hypothetical protein
MCAAHEPVWATKSRREIRDMAVQWEYRLEYVERSVRTSSLERVSI